MQVRKVAKFTVTTPVYNQDNESKRQGLSVSSFAESFKLIDFQVQVAAKSRLNLKWK